MLGIPGSTARPRSHASAPTSPVELTGGRAARLMSMVHYRRPRPGTSIRAGWQSLITKLDELTDTARRAEATAIVERFQRGVPLARVLVTSRLIGYEEAQLDDRQFTCYRIGGCEQRDRGRSRTAHARLQPTRGLKRRHSARIPAAGHAFV